MTKIDTPAKRRIGVLGGTFDPVHLAHLALAEASSQQLQLDQVLFVPCARPPHRPSASATDDQRVEMLKLAIGARRDFSICHYELCKQSTSYTVETLQYLVQQNDSAEFYFLMGSDSLENFTQWFQWRSILKLAQLVVYRRELDPESRTDFKETELEEAGARIYRLQGKLMSISATGIRGRAGDSNIVLKNCLNPAVHSYIMNNRIYQ